MFDTLIHRQQQKTRLVYISTVTVTRKQENVSLIYLNQSTANNHESMELPDILDYIYINALATSDFKTLGFDPSPPLQQIACESFSLSFPIDPSKKKYSSFIIRC